MLFRSRLMGEGARERERAVIAALDRVAAELGVARAIVVAAWVHAHPARPVPILGSQSPGRLRALRSAADVVLSRAQWYDILVAARGAPMP